MPIPEIPIDIRLIDFMEPHLRAMQLKDEIIPFHQLGPCPMCSYANGFQKTLKLRERIIIHGEVDFCCKQEMYIVGMWPWLYLYCTRCGKKVKWFQNQERTDEQQHQKTLEETDQTTTPKHGE